MRTPVFTGNCVAIATPFDANGNINYDAFGRLIDNQIEGGVDAICVCGTTGESATMTIREHIAVVEYCVKRVNHRVKVMAGAGSHRRRVPVPPRPGLRGGRAAPRHSLLQQVQPGGPCEAL